MRSISTDGYVEDWFGDAFEKLAEAYPAVKIRAGMAKIYAQALADLEPEQVLGAFGRAVRECKWFPSVAEIRGFVVPPAEEAAQNAWTQLLEAARDHGAWQSIEVEDACAAEALRRVAGSWGAFCELEGPGLANARTAFLAAYKDARRAAPPAHEPVRFAGLAEAGGSYQRIPASWRVRLTAGGGTTSERERPALTPGEVLKRLTTGDGTDGEARESTGPSGSGR